ncbi:MASE3 domain-containing protein [Sporosarcina sp. 179-K 3D1 HS]|uniref:sensor histidine kinase n=1 Tax=Sporosarcina sp. 179-K 3D1 HS TaxID=3232169 RepID=UPI0039A3E9C0
MSSIRVESPINLRKYELRYLYIGFLAILLMWVVRVFFNHEMITIQGPQFLLAHTLLESFSIFVSFSIFIQAMITYSKDSQSVNFFIGLIFFAVGAYDLIHTLVYRGMPFYEDEFSANRATWLWIFARLSESIGMAAAVILPHKVMIQRTTLALFVSTLSVSLIGGFLFLRQDLLPTLLDNEFGITNMKVSLEYIICTFMLVTLIALVAEYRNTRNLDTLRLALAIFIIMTGELYFTLYDKVYDIENLVGHIYKFVGYVYVFRAVFYPQIRHILTDKEKAESKWREAEHMLFEAEKNLSKLVLQAHEEERKRVSRELHDGIGQSLYSILMTLNMAENEIRGEDKPPSLQKAKRMTADAMVEVKEIAHSLRPSSLDDLGFLPALKMYIDQFEKVHDVQIKLKSLGDKQRLDPEIETTLYRICQESLTNSAKYANPNHIMITLKNDPNGIQLTIQDDGVGFSIVSYLKGSQRKGIGLFSMKERAEACGGTFELQSKLNEGTTTIVSIPK